MPLQPRRRVVNGDSMWLASSGIIVLSGSTSEHLPERCTASDHDCVNVASVISISSRTLLNGSSASTCVTIVCEFLIASMKRLYTLYIQRHHRRVVVECWWTNPYNAQRVGKLRKSINTRSCVRSINRYELQCVLVQIKHGRNVTSCLRSEYLHSREVRLRPYVPRTPERVSQQHVCICCHDRVDHLPRCSTNFTKLHLDLRT